MPFVALVHSRDPGPPPENPFEGREWQPNWRVWRWLVGAVVVGFAAWHADGAVQALLVFAVIALVCQAVSDALPYPSGLREWRQ